MSRTIYAIGARIREQRKAKSWTQKDLAQRIGTSPKYLSHVENGAKFPSLEMLICLARELDVSLDSLISTASRQNNTNNTSTLPDPNALLTGCTEEEKAFLLDVMGYIRGRMRKSVN